MSRKRMTEVYGDIFRREIEDIKNRHNMSAELLTKLTAPHVKKPRCYFTECASAGRVPTEVLDALIHIFGMTETVIKIEEPEEQPEATVTEQMQLQMPEDDITAKLDRIIKMLENISGRIV